MPSLIGYISISSRSSEFRHIPQPTTYNPYPKRIYLFKKNLHFGNSIYDNFQPVNHEDKKSHPSGPGPGNRSYFGARTSQLYPLPFVGARLMGGYVRH